MRGQRLLVLALVGFVSFVSGGWLLQRGTQRAGNVYQQARLFDDVLGYVADYSVDSMSEAELYDKAIDGLLDQLNDPYARFLRREDFEELTESTTGNYGGLGIRIDVRDGWITIIAPIAETPAADAGLETGDRIVAVDGRSTFGWKSDKAVAELRGEPGSSVTISVARPGMPEPMDLSIERAIIHIKAIQLATVLQGDVGYLSLVQSSISEKLAGELVEALEDLRSKGARSLVLDLRSNPGGLLDQGVEVSDLFLDPGAAVVQTRGRARGTTESFTARSPQRWPDMPIVVLTNGGTASAAEIIAGALQDHDRALLLGTSTFGKGLVQTVFRLGRTEALRLTTARWFTPSGRTIQRIDHQSEVMVAAADSTEEAAVEPDTMEMFRTDAGRPMRGGGGIRPDLTVYPDTLLDTEKDFVRALGAKLPVYRDVMTSYALELKASGAIKDERFRVSPAMRQEFLRRLSGRDISLSAGVAAGASDLIDQELSYELQRYVFGRASESQRRLRDDPQVQKAVAMLKEAQTMPELIALAEREKVELSRKGS
ncbi:MAG: S41 family peptidase [Gemmatimonadota bacterium]|nr:S41 family peptidase [Gemmatimonadota bacterium]MDH3478619.1 S41 family peptidase [Gemmatimonadota bacterium]